MLLSTAKKGNRQPIELFESDTIDKESMPANSLDESFLRHPSSLHDESSRHTYTYTYEMARSHSLDRKDILHEINHQKLDFAPKEITKRNLNSTLMGKIEQYREHTEQITFVCFKQWRVLFDRSELETYLNAHSGDQQVDEQTCSAAIEAVVRKLFAQEMHFEPLQVNSSNFTLMVAGSEGENFICLDDEHTSEMWSRQEISLARVSRQRKKKTQFQALKQQGRDLQLLEILSPDQRDLVEKIEKFKTIKDLKEKLSGYYYHLVGRMVLVTYSNLRVMDNKKKISDLPEKILEIYQTKSPTFEDTTFLKQGEPSLFFNDSNCIVVEQSESEAKLDEIVINQSFLHGKTYLRIEDGKIIERYVGGIAGYFLQNRTYQRSLLTLTAAKIVSTSLYLQFTYKDGTEIVMYDFENKSTLHKVLLCVLVVTRNYNHKLQILP